MFYPVGECGRPKYEELVVIRSPGSPVERTKSFERMSTTTKLHAHSWVEVNAVVIVIVRIETRLENRWDPAGGYGVTVAGLGARNTVRRHDDDYGEHRNG